MLKNISLEYFSRLRGDCEQALRVPYLFVNSNAVDPCCHFSMQALAQPQPLLQKRIEAIKGVVERLILKTA